MWLKAGLLVGGGVLVACQTGNLAPPPSDETVPIAITMVAPIPRGEKIFYRDFLKATIGVVQLDGSGNQTILTSTWDIRDYAVNPDGQTIALSIRDPSGEKDAEGYVGLHAHTWIYSNGQVKKITGLEVQNIDDRSYVWHPDGRRLYITRQSNIQVKNKKLYSDRNRIYVIQRDGGDEHPLPFYGPETVGEVATSISPDGKRLAYTWYDLASDSPAYLGFMSVYGENRQETPLEGARAECVWSPKGDQLACLDGFIRGKLLLVDINGHTVQTLIDDGLVFTTPSWSPDGRQIAYVQEMGDTLVEDIYIIDIETMQRRKVTKSPGNYAPIYWMGQ